MNTLGVIVMIAALLIWPIVASADDVIDSKEFSPGQDGHLVPDDRVPLPWVAIFLGLLSIVVILAPAFKDARRTHLD